MYLVYFGVYSLAIYLLESLPSGRVILSPNSLSEREKIGLCRLFFTFGGNLVPAATILRLYGNVYQNRVAVISMSVIQMVCIRALMLYAISNRLAATISRFHS